MDRKLNLTITINPNRVSVASQERIKQKLRWVFGNRLRVQWITHGRLGQAIIWEFWPEHTPDDLALVSRIITDEANHNFTTPFTNSGRVKRGRLDLQTLPKSL